MGCRRRSDETGDEGPPCAGGATGHPFPEAREMTSMRKTGRARRLSYSLLAAVLLLAGCGSADVPESRNVNIPNPAFADKRRDAVNERPDSVMYLPLGRDVLM